MPINTIKLKEYSTFSRTQVWRHLKADMEDIKQEFSQLETDPKSSFDAVKRDIKRSNAISIINRIIALIEKADDKISKVYEAKRKK